jgi:hypothetical protein
MKNNRAIVTLAAAAILLVSTGPAYANATVTIINGNAPGVGFNDPTPATPVGGNTGATLGQQRLIAFQSAANTWGNSLSSNVEIKVLATFEPLTCTATSAVLGSAGTIYIFADFGSVGLFPGPEFAHTWYHSALAKKRAGTDLNPGNPDIRARFNVNLGNPGCLTGVGWYLGLDNNHGAQIDLVTVLQHEFAHGLGFSQFANVTTGAEPGDMTDVYARQLLDVMANKSWDQMTDAERAASSINSRKVVWTGPNVTNSVPGVLSAGVPILRISSPSSIAGDYSVGRAAFGPPLSSPGIAGNIVLALDPADGAGPSTTDGCSALTNAAAISGKLALLDRGTCGFVVKVKNAQNAGAIGVIIADNVAGSPPADLGGADPTITIPPVRISLADGNTIKGALVGGVTATLGVDLGIRSGADAQGRALMNAPNPVQPGSSISHWDPIAFPNQLMEPNISSDLTHSVAPPLDLTLPLLRDVGWFPDVDLDGLADNADACPNSNLSPKVTINACQTGVPSTLLSNGCTINDLVARCSANATNHGNFVSCVSATTDTLRKNRVITGGQKDAIISCAASAGTP